MNNIQSAYFTNVQLLVYYIHLNVSGCCLIESIAVSVVNCGGKHWLRILSAGICSSFEETSASSIRNLVNWSFKLNNSCIMSHVRFCF